MSGTGPSSQDDRQPQSRVVIDLGVGTDTIKFTTATSADAVTVAPAQTPPITGAKYLTYEDAANAVAITTGAGADLVVL